MTEQKIVPNLWFDGNALEAAEFYVSVFPDGGIDGIVEMHDTPSGDSQLITFHLGDSTFMALDGGPFFSINPSISFFLNFDPSRDPEARKKLTKLWEELAREGTPLMPLQEYPFSPLYGWVRDRFGVTWQLILTDPDGEERPFIVPSLMFTGENCGRAEEATDYYISVFRNSRRGLLARYPAGMEPDREGTLMFTDFMLEGQWFAAMESAGPHEFGFNEAVSLLVNCETQQEIDFLWGTLSAVPEAEHCGWLKDRYGVSWQVAPAVLNRLMAEGTRQQVDRLTQGFLTMKKLEIDSLLELYRD